MSNQLPPDLKVLCRKLTSIPPAQLPHSLPCLVRHVLNCRDALSAPQDQKLKADASQAALHIHKLRTSITTLLNGRSREGRFVAIGLIKAAVDVGGWETLRGAEPWVRGLLSIVQKADPVASKELAVVTLTKIYLLVQSYQTLVREIATPTLPAYITACLQLIKPKTAAAAAAAAASSSSSSSSSSQTLAETICESFTTLIPLYATTFRPFGSQVKNAVRGFLAPTPADGFTVPEPLQAASRRLVASLHHVAAKSSGSEEWAKLLDDVLGEFHATADQVFRAVDEAWAAESGRARPGVDAAEGEPRGGGGDPSADKLPPWSGLDAGAARLIGIFDYLAAVLACPTKSAVAIPLGRVMETVARVCLIAKLSRSQTWEQSVETNPAVGRDEKDELWSTMPEIHVAAMRLVAALLSRLGRHMLPLVPEILDHLVRIFKSGIAVARVRAASYVVLGAALRLAGPTLSKTSINMLEPLLAACCRDLQQHASVLEIPDKPSTATGKDAKKGSAAVNTDLFLKPQAGVGAGAGASSSASASNNSAALDADHAAAARDLLPLLLAHLPQSSLKPIIRGLLDKTAILTRNRDAMLASVLSPYKDQRGRMYPSILPHLTRQFPHDQALEVLRSNLRTASLGNGSGGDLFASLGEDIELQDAEEEQESNSETREDGEEEEEEAEKDNGTDGRQDAEKHNGGLLTTGQAKVDLPIQVNPFEANPQRESSPLGKRKHSESADAAQPTKRQELEQSQEPARVAELPSIIPAPVEGAMDEDSDDDDDSVHLEMVLEDDEDEDEDE
ncbi:Pre-rRNA-processing protein rix1 [Escovopsis weberi]|uniref:Pre-rRNA-processing protein RIX1 n=1 Tax=Escovopsis weberi TaxID=150374 RepID=A0A0M8MSP0_ESCWE|nr:Pre-rRNA-processing protein rix1 [Escovopsis weberi]